MALKSLNLFLPVRRLAVRVRILWFRLVRGADIDPSVNLSLSGRVLPGRRGSIVVGPETLIAFKTLIFTSDGLTGEDRPVRIGARCFIGGGSVVLPGVTIGDECIVGGGAVVFDDVPPRTMVGGNPARILRTDIEVGAFGRLIGADEVSHRMWHAQDP